jgi:NarL family two-component system response regulator LiaR
MSQDSLHSVKDPAPKSQETPKVRTVLLVDDSDFERVIIRSAVEGLTNFQVCGEASNGVEGIEKAVELKPDLVVMDLAMPLLNGLEAATVLKTTMPGLPVVLLTLYADQIQGLKSAAFGVTVVLSKFDGLAPLLQCIQRLLGSTS